MLNPTKSHLFNKLKIHHPLPLSPRESKQLLNLLTSSFRQHLDTEHPAFKTEAGQSVASRPPPDSIHKEHAKPRRKSLPEPWRTPTDRHMHSMLTNPLFNYDNASRTLQKSPLQPMDVFDLAVGKGMMTIDYAKALLKANKRAIVESHLPDVREGMKESGAGLKVLRWLKASGTTNDLKFLQDEAFGGILVEHLVAEGLDEAVWSWIRKSFEGIPRLSTLEGPEWTRARREIVNPLMFLVHAEANGHRSLNNAFMCLSRAAGYLKGAPAQTMIHILEPPGRYLATTAIFTHSRRATFSDSDFESFMSLLPVIFKAGNLQYYLAQLSLIHPTKPRVDLALDFLRTMGLPTSRPVYTRGYIQLGLDSAKHLLEKDRVKEALWVMDVLRANFPKQLGVEQKKQLEEVKAEASTLEMLDGLSLA